MRISSICDNFRNKSKKILSDPLNALSLFFSIIRGGLIKVKFKVLNNKVKIGSGLRAYSGIKISGPGKVIIGDKVSFDMSFLRIPAIVTHTKKSVVRIGNGSYLGGIRISCVDSVSIGDDVLMGSTTVMDSDIIPSRITKIDEQWIRHNVKAVKIGSRVWTGTNSFILKGTTLQDEAVIGAGSVVREKDVPLKVLMVGNPARKISLKND